MAIIETVLLRALPIFLATGCIVGLIVGAVLILRPHWLVRAKTRRNRQPHY